MTVDSPAHPAPGDVVAGKYRVERVLGAGGMGLVLVATHLHLDEQVAIKLLHGPLAQDKEIVGRFIREGKATIRIRSEHVVRVFDVGLLESGAPFMIMELLDGRDLDRLIRDDGPQPIASTIDLVLQACEALAEAHKLGMVHRDLKPANLYLSARADGSPLLKVLDFGISKVTGAGGANLGLTKTSAVMGSPLYMAPEQMRSMRSVDARTDVWALGTILHQLITGHVPFDAQTLPELCASILQDPAPPLRARRPDAPLSLERAIHRCLEKEPANRFANVAELAAAIAEHGSPAARASSERIAKVLGVDASKGPNAALRGMTTPMPAPSADGPAQSGLRSSGTSFIEPPMMSSAKPVTGPQPAPATTDTAGATGTAWGQTQSPSRTRGAALVAIAIGALALVSIIVGVAVHHFGRATPTAASPLSKSLDKSSAAVASDPGPPSATTTASAASDVALDGAAVPHADASPVLSASGGRRVNPGLPASGSYAAPQRFAKPTAGGLFDDRK